jgi:hypothetical protein
VAEFTAQSESTAALAVDTGFLWAHAVTGGGYKLVEVTLGVRAATGVPTSMQCVVGIARATTAGTTPTAVTASKVDPNSPSVTTTFASAFATPPTLATPDMWRIAFNTQTTLSLPLGFVVAAGTANGLAFVNRDNALPASHQYVISVRVLE